MQENIMTKNVIALYDDLSDAQQALSDLVSSGFDRNRISLVANDSSNEYSRYLNTSDRTVEADEDAVTGSEGAGFGAVVGAITGVIAGLGALAIPGIGPVVAAGPLVAALTGGAIGAVAGGATGGITAALVKTGVSPENADYYAEGIRRGGTLVIANCSDEQAPRAQEILNRYHPVDIKSRGEEYRSSGWTGYREDAEPYHPTRVNEYRAQAMNSRASAQNINANGGEVVLPVVEEELQVGKREVEQGGVRVTKQVTEKPVEAQVNLREERVTVDRRPVDRPISTADATAFKEQTIELTEKAEQPVVQKTAHVVEEVRVGKEATEHTETLRDTVRRSDVNVEQVAGSQTTGVRAFDTYNTDWRNDYNTRYGGSGYTYDQYVPVYRYGYDLANDSRYTGQDWSAVESSARRDWEQRYPNNAWEDFKDAIRYGWDRVRGKA
jgi:uncharacterized protein (TIGR02271 family)